MILELENGVNFTPMFMDKILLVLDYPSIISWEYEIRFKSEFGLL